MPADATIQKLLDEVLESQAIFNTKIAALSKAIREAATPTEPANPLIPDAKVNDKLTIKSVNDKTVVTDGSVKISKGSLVSFLNGRTTTVVAVDGATIVTSEIPADSKEARDKLVGQTLTVARIGLAPTTPTTPPPKDESGSISPPVVSDGQPVGTTSVVVFTNEHWKNGVWNIIQDGKIRPGVVMPKHVLIVVGAVVLFSDGTKATVNEVQEGDTNNSVWLDKAPDPDKVAANNLVTIISSPYKAPPTTTTPSKIGAKGSKKKAGMAVLGFNDGQSAGGVIIRKDKMDYGWSDEASIKILAADGITQVRISLLWERIQPTLFGDIDAKYGAELIAVLKLYKKYGIRVSICQAHNYAGYSFTNSANDRIQLGNSRVPKGCLADLSFKLVTFLMKDSEAFNNVYELEFMNEPINLSSPKVIFDEYQLCINSVRRIDKRLLLGVDGYPWATTRNFLANNLPLFDLVDPENKIRIHSHWYGDPDNGGDYAEADSLINPDEMVKYMDAVMSECKKRGWKHVFSEMGAPAMKQVNGVNVPTPNALRWLDLSLEKALYGGSDVQGWWSSRFQSNDRDNVNSIYAPRNADARKTYLQYL